MFADGPNPAKIQVLPPRKRFTAPAPLVLFHDGGGTTFSYFILGSLNREVYAIHNPNYFSGEPFKGGMNAMARHYIDLMTKAGISGQVILGGWSLGGYLSLAIARMLADDPKAKISVVGQLIIDSPHHVPRQTIRDEVAEPALDNLPELILKAFVNCDIMLDDWNLPAWSQPSATAKPANISVSGKKFSLTRDNILYKPYNGEWETRTTEMYPEEQKLPAGARPGKVAPPAVMLRCVDNVPKANEGAQPCLIDMHRDKLLLGWEGNYPDFIKAVIDVGGHHYSVFDKYDPEKMSYLTARINEGLEIIESQKPRAKPKASMDFFF